MTRVDEFRKLNNNDEILYIGNVWDVNSALIFEKLNYKVLGTSSFAMAKSLSYEDGEELEFEQLCRVVKEIILKVSIPVSVDIEGGYSRDVNEIVNNITKLYNLGVVGINIEDSIVKNGEREILPIEEFTEIIRIIKDILQKKDIDIFINVRTDSFIIGLENPLDETLKRIKSYEKNGADGIFVPIVNIEDIKDVVNSTSLAVNVMTMPNLPSFDILEDIGVRRVSQGPFVYTSLMEDLESKLNKINNNRNFEDLF